MRVQRGDMASDLFMWLDLVVVSGSMSGLTISAETQFINQLVDLLKINIPFDKWLIV